MQSREAITRSFLACVGSLLLLAGCGDPPPGEGVDQAHEAVTMPAIVSAAEAVNTPEIPAIDLQTMDDAEFEEIIPAGPRCTFSYTRESPPVLAAGISGQGARGAVRIHGKRVEVTDRETKTFAALSAGATLTADGLRVRVSPDDEPGREKLRRQANVVLELTQGFKVGYRGWYTCSNEKTGSGAGS